MFKGEFILREAICTSHMLSNFTHGKHYEFKLVNKSYKDNTKEVAIVDDNGKTLKYDNIKNSFTVIPVLKYKSYSELMAERMGY